MSDFPPDFIDTGDQFAGVDIGTSDIVPLCYRAFLMRGEHQTTKTPGWYAFCKRKGELEHVGPYRTVYEALEMLILTKGCDECSFNQDSRKGRHLEYIKELENVVRNQFSDETILETLQGPVFEFVYSRVIIDIHFKPLFKTRLFRSLPDDSVAALSLVKPATNSIEFANKIMALAGLLERINTNDVRKNIQADNRDDINGSIRILEQLLKENAKDFPKHIISNFKNLQALRSKLYPAHSTASDLLKILNNFGLSKYPPDNWEEMFLHILNLVNKSMQSLVKVLQDLYNKL